MTGFPNFFNNTDQASATDIVENIDIAVAAGCSEVTTEFLCGLLVPECRENEGFVLPNRTMCKEFYGEDAGCGFLFELTGKKDLIYDCDVYFAENPEPICPSQFIVPATEDTTTLSTIATERGQYVLLLMLM